jgi:serine/threonine protein kinase
VPHEANPEAQRESIARLTAGYLRPGLIVDERYKIEAFLGAGGMCSVYKAEHLNLQRPVALKFLRADFATTDAIERFRHETIAVSAMDHPNIVEVYGWGVFQNRPYMAMEFLDGISLSAVLAREPNNRLPEEKALPIFVQICDALIHAHEKGIIHRDLKPSNVMLVENEQKVRLVDFGVAKILPESGKELQKLTQTGSLLGSVPYMSPEQCLCQPLDARSDIYSLGCLMYEVITSEPPFTGSSAYATISHHVHTEVRQNELLKTQIGDVILSCLAKDPQKRPQSATALKDALQNPGQVPKSIGKTQHKLLVCAAMSLALLGVGLGVAVSFLVSSHAVKLATDEIHDVDARLDNLEKQAIHSTENRPDAGKSLAAVIENYRQALQKAQRTKDQPAINEAKAKLAHALTDTALIAGINNTARDNEAVALCQDVLGSEPPRNRLSSSCLLALETIGDAYMNLQDFTTARRYVDDFDNLCGPDLHPWGLMRQGKVYLGRGFWTDAMIKFQTALQQFEARKGDGQIPCAARGGRQTLQEAQLGLARADLGESGGAKDNDNTRNAVEILKQLAQPSSTYGTGYYYRHAAQKLLEQLREPL